MASSPQHSTAAQSRSRSFLLALVCLIGTACSSTSPTGKAHFEDPRGTVFFQAISDQSIQASHPINLEPTLIARVLNGLHVQERQRALQEILVGSSSATPVFSEEQVQFLTPRIAKALTTATTGKAVAFLVTSPRPDTSRLEHSVTETTVGSLYAYGRSLYVTLSQYRYSPTQANTDSFAHRRLPDTSGLSNRTLLFTPSSAQQPDSVHRPTGGTATDRFLAIDLQLLQLALPSATATELTPPQAEHIATPMREPLAETRATETPTQTTKALSQRDEEIYQLKDLVIKKDLELETLRKELQSIRKQLDSHKRKPTPPSKLPQTTP
jgi:hypothetical protein